MKIKSLFLNLAAVFAIGAAAGAQAAPILITASSTDVPVEICDLCSVTSTVNIGTHGRVVDVNALLDITHSWDADLILSLTHGAKTIILSNRQGGSGGADYSGTLFDDAAAVAINAGFAYAPYSGSFKPEELLAAFNDMDVFGAWTLTAFDNEFGDSGFINSFAITAQVPEPGTMALFGLGLAGFAAMRRRKQV
ncbi:MAG: PEP-CTERM sorting domain-containing protein [Massilia sp.]